MDFKSGRLNTITQQTSRLELDQMHKDLFLFVSVFKQLFLIHPGILPGMCLMENLKEI